MVEIRLYMYMYRKLGDGLCLLSCAWEMLGNSICRSLPHRSYASKNNLHVALSYPFHRPQKISSQNHSCALLCRGTKAQAAGSIRRICSWFVTMKIAPVLTDRIVLHIWHSLICVGKNYNARSVTIARYIASVSSNNDHAHVVAMRRSN